MTRLVARLLTALSADAAARLDMDGDDYVLAPATGRQRLRVSAAIVREMLARGLLVRAEGGAIAASDLAAGWVKRRESDALSFRRQHGEIEPLRLDGADGAELLVNLDESPVGALARRPRVGGAPWLEAHAVTAAERLRRDFEVGQLQPRVTANWSASVATRRRSDGGGVADLTEMAISARRRFDRAMRNVGPELSGILVDICCLLKGLETVERERQWPARSAKLVLRIALGSLARHYGYSESGSGNERPKGTRHWGTGDYRPEIS